MGIYTGFTMTQTQIDYNWEQKKKRDGYMSCGHSIEFLVDGKCDFCDQTAQMNTQQDHDRCYVHSGMFLPCALCANYPLEEKERK